MVDDGKINLAGQLLSRAKRLAPDRVPKPDRATAEAWASALDRLLDNFPLVLWQEAVELWATELVGDRMITPKELKSAAFSVRDRWEATPAKREMLNHRRQQQQELRDRQLADGSFSALRGYVPPSRGAIESQGQPARGLSQIGD